MTSPLLPVHLTLYTELLSINWFLLINIANANFSQFKTIKAYFCWRRPSCDATMNKYFKEILLYTYTYATCALYRQLHKKQIRNKRKPN